MPHLYLTISGHPLRRLPPSFAAVGEIKILSRALRRDRTAVRINNQALPIAKAGVTAIEADIRQPARILDHPGVTEFIDLTEPVAVLFIAVLHFIPDEQDPWGIVSQFRDRIAPGSYIAISAATTEGLSPQEINEFVRPYEKASSTATLRSRPEIARFFDGLDLLEPGLVGISHWGATGLHAPEPLAAVGRKP